MSIGYFIFIIGLFFIIELPDKSFIATIVMATKARPIPVLIGASLALVIHMGIACAAGQLIATFPTTIKEIVIAILFLGGAAYLLLVPEKVELEKGEEEGSAEKSSTWWKELTVAFSVIFVGEFGDITQIQAANLTAKTHLPIAVFFASSIGLILVEIVGVYGGQFLVKKFSLQKIRYAGGIVFAGLGIYSVFQLITK